jgi:hypothetical protein
VYEDARFSPKQAGRTLLHSFFFFEIVIPQVCLAMGRVDVARISLRAFFATAARPHAHNSTQPSASALLPACHMHGQPLMAGPPTTRGGEKGIDRLGAWPAASRRVN